MPHTSVCDTRCVFFDDHPEFLDTSSTANNRLRLNLRHLAIVEGHRELLQGARVLDIASHDGRWSYAALEVGASHVTGIEGRRYLVKNANKTLAQKGVDPSRFTFIHGDAHDALTAGVGTVDVVMLLGFLYHTLRYPELFAGIRATGARHIIIDSAVAFGRIPFLGKLEAVRNAPLIRLASNPNKRESAAVQDKFSYQGHSLVGIPTLTAIVHMLDAYGYDLVGQSNWKDILRQHPEGKQPASQYAKGARVTLLAVSRD